MKVKKPDSTTTVKLEQWEVERLIKAARQVQDMYAYTRADSDAPYIGDALAILSDLAEELR